MNFMRFSSPSEVHVQHIKMAMKYVFQLHCVGRFESHMEGILIIFFFLYENMENMETSRWVDFLLHYSCVRRVVIKNILIG